MGYDATPTIFSRPGTIGLVFVPVTPKLFTRSYGGLFSDKLGLTHVVSHAIDTGDNSPVASRPCRYDRVKQEKTDYHVNKMLRERTIIPIQSPYALPMVLCRKNNGLLLVLPEFYRFAIDYRKLSAIIKYPRYTLPVIDYLIMNIPSTTVLTNLDLRSGYFQLAANRKNFPKTAFVTKRSTFAFTRMSFDLSGVAPSFQKVIDIILGTGPYRALSLILLGNLWGQNGISIQPSQEETQYAD
ncbi:retrovirus-related Pol polyprotein from transposon 17.6 [Trichonephila clavipes]|nr:retrovirus-related Pol polyprotein from transposon 17.6 [Trichonephila clavipes]